jgi:hypothetical protein
MNRWIAALGCALVLASVAPLANQAQADGMRPKVYGKTKCVVAARMWMSQTTWSCARGQKCCYDWLMRTGTCLAATDRCR